MNELDPEIIEKWLKDELPIDQRDQFETRLLYDTELQAAVKAVNEKLGIVKFPRARSGVKAGVLCAAGAVISAVLAIVGYRMFFEPTEIAELRQLDTQTLALGQTRGSKPAYVVNLEPDTDVVVLELDLGIALDPEYDVELVKDGEVVWSGSGSPRGDKLVLTVSACDLSPGTIRARVSAGGASIATYAFEVR